MAIQKIAVLGAGNGGCAAAADLTLKGYEVRLYSRSQTTLEPILRSGGIELIEGTSKRFATPRVVTSNIAEAVSGAELIVVTAPAIAHAFFAAALAPRLTGEEIILLNPGHTGGALHFVKALRENEVTVKIRSCETVTLAYICRMAGAAKVEVYKRTARLRCAAFPGRWTSEIVPQIRQIYPDVVEAQNVMQTGLSNINAIMHPAGMIGNAGWIEKSGGDFCFYSEGITPAIANLIAAVDRERLRITGRLGLPPESFVEIFYQAGLAPEGARASASVYRAIHESAPNRSIKSPRSLRHRYVDEDVGYGLVPMAAIGKLLRLECPVIDALITLASEINETDYRKEGLTLDKMGLDRVKAEDLPALLEEGF